MKVKVMKEQRIPYLKHCAMASTAAIAALNTLEKEGTYTEENSDRLWDTAWTAADYSIVCEDASIEEATWLAEEAARRHARAMIGGNVRLKYIHAGKLVPAWRVQLAQLQQQLAQ
jgi:hypothetical protein